MCDSFLATIHRDLKCSFQFKKARSLRLQALGIGTRHTIGKCAKNVPCLGRKSSIPVFLLIHAVVSFSTLVHSFQPSFNRIPSLKLSILSLFSQHVVCIEPFSSIIWRWSAGMFVIYIQSWNRPHPRLCTHGCEDADTNLRQTTDLTDVEEKVSTVNSLIFLKFDFHLVCYYIS